MKTFSNLSFLVAFVCIFQNARPHSPTWTDDIACIIFSHCTGCHNPKGIAPFSLTTYGEVFVNRLSIAASIQGNSMPPFPPSQKHRRYAYANTLTPHERDELIQWVLNYAPYGDATKHPTPPSFNSKFQIKNPDAVLQIPHYNVNTVNDLYRVFVIPLNNPSREYIQSIEVVPGNRDIVHHALIYQDTSSIPLNLDKADPLPGYTAFGSTGSPTSKVVWTFSPGQGAFDYLPGFGVELLPQSFIIIQIHYPGGISNEVDSTQIRLKLSNNMLRNVDTEALADHRYTLVNGPLFIKANTVKTFRSQYAITKDYTCSGVLPHMHLLGKRIKSYCVTSMKDTIRLIDIPEWDFHWQGFYHFQKPILLPAGSTVYTEATYDNTSSNLNNPHNPPINVRAGSGTDDEMLLVYFSLSDFQSGDTTIVIDTSGHFPHVVCYPNSTSAPNDVRSTQFRPYTNSNTTGLPDTKYSDEINIFPNPANNYFVLDGIQGNYDLTLYTASGRIIIQNNGCEGTQKIEQLNLPEGIYFLRIDSDSHGAVHRRIAIRH